MRHLHFVQSTEPLEGGGLGRAALELSHALVKSGAGSRLVTTQTAGERVRDGFAAWGRRGPTKAFYAPGMWRVAEELVAACDVVHGHGFYVAPNWVFGREVRRQGKALVYHAHGMFEPWILGRSQGKKRVAHWLFENANFRHARLWRALTGREADQIRAQGITAPVVVCPNGIDLEVFASVPALREAGLLTKTRRELLFLARLHPKKGLDLLMRAWGALPISLRADWRIVVAGPDELGHRAEIEALIVKLGIIDNVVFMGSVSGADKLAALATADAFVLPSYSEGFSVAILEALACRLPVVATEACNFPDLATQGGGWCVPATVAGVQRGLTELLSLTEVERLQRGEQGRALIERAYTWSQIALQLDSACRGLIA